MRHVWKITFASYSPYRGQDDADKAPETEKIEAPTADDALTMARTNYPDRAIMKIIYLGACRGCTSRAYYPDCPLHG